MGWGVAAVVADRSGVEAALQCRTFLQCERERERERGGGCAPLTVPNVDVNGGSVKSACRDCGHSAQLGRHIALSMVVKAGTDQLEVEELMSAYIHEKLGRASKLE